MKQNRFNMLAKYKLLILFVVVSFFGVVGGVQASKTEGTIDPAHHYAWGENVGWVDFATSTVAITDSAVTGNIYGENVGWINLNLANTSAGILSGQAWGENVGWVDFSHVTIDNHGVFTGAAYGENIGWIKFGTTTNKVVTDWRPAIVRQPLTLTKNSLSPVKAEVNAEPDYFYVRLKVQPSADVSLAPVSSINDSLLFDKRTLTFTSSNWGTYQSLVVYANSTSSASTVNLTFAINSADENYDNLDPVASTTVNVSIGYKKSYFNNGSATNGEHCTGLCGGSSPTSTIIVVDQPVAPKVPTQIVAVDLPAVINYPFIQSVQSTVNHKISGSSVTVVMPAGTIITPATLAVNPKEAISALLPVLPKGNNAISTSTPPADQELYLKPINDVIFDVTLKDNFSGAYIESLTSSNLQLTFNLPAISKTEDAKTIGLYYLDESESKWVRVKFAFVSPTEKQVIASLNHLTKFAVFRSTAETMDTSLPVVVEVPPVEPEVGPGFQTDTGDVPTEAVFPVDEPVAIVVAPTLTAEQLKLYRGKFIKDSKGNAFYVDQKNDAVTLVTSVNASSFLAKTAIGIKDKDLIKISNLGDKTVSAFSRRFYFKILLQVDNKGQLWYVNRDCKKTKVYDALGLAIKMATEV